MTWGSLKPLALLQTCEIHVVVCIALSAAGTQPWHGREPFTVVGTEKGSVGWAGSHRTTGVVKKLC